MKEQKALFENLLNFQTHYNRKGEKNSNILIKNALKYLKYELGNNEEEALRKRIKNNIIIIKSNISDLEYDSLNQPFKILGIPVTISLLKSLGIGIGSGLSILIQSSVSKIK